MDKQKRVKVDYGRLVRAAEMSGMSDHKLSRDAGFDKGFLCRTFRTVYMYGSVTEKVCRKLEDALHCGREAFTA